MDLIGPWVVQVHSNPYEFDTLTVIDTVTNLVDLIRGDKKSQMLLQESMHNDGYHITSGHKDVYMIQEENLLESDFKHYYNIVTSEMCAQVLKPQSNAICKRIHQTVGNVQRILLHSEPPQNIADA
jgi:hypothetical protein